MATLAENNAYLLFNAVDLSGRWTGELSREVSANTNEITAGAGQDWIQRAAGLKDVRLTFSIMYDSATLAADVAALDPGTTATLEYGPEGNTTGEPRHAQTMILESVSQPQTISKEAVMFELTFVGADTPTAWIENGDVFP